MKTYVFLLTVACLLTPSPSAFGEDDKVPWAPVGPIPIPNTAPPIGYQAPTAKPSWLSTFCRELQERIYSNWEPSNLEADKSITIGLEIQANGIFDHIKLVRSSGLNQADFAAIEAVYETSGFTQKIPPLVKNIEIRLKRQGDRKYFDCADRYFRDHSRAVWHIMPLEAINAGIDVPPSAIHKSENLRLLKPGSENSDSLNAARKEWSALLHTGARMTLSDIEKSGQQLEQKYSFLFEK